MRGQLFLGFRCCSYFSTMLTRPGVSNYKSMALLPSSGISSAVGHSNRANIRKVFPDQNINYPTSGEQTLVIHNYEVAMALVLGTGIHHHSAVLQVMETLMNTQTLSTHIVECTDDVILRVNVRSFLSVPSSEHVYSFGDLETQRKSMTYGKTSEMQNWTKGTNWSPSTTALTPEACCVDYDTSQTIKRETSLMANPPPLSLTNSTLFMHGLRKPTPFLL